MAAWTDPQLVELFHVAFLDVLATKVSRGRYVLKGGANLRYFFGSPRYSEGLDLDAREIEQWKLEERIDQALGSPQLEVLLRQSGLEVAEVSKPKQTGTTQRWKAGLRLPGRRLPVRTKIEFSHRRGDDRHRLEPIPEEIVRPYGLRPPSVQHYLEDAAIEQKVLALAQRTQTQARDVFDLDLLLRSRSAAPKALDAEVLRSAAERALDLSFAEFRDQVVEFLEDGAVALYDSPEAWEGMQVHVAGKLEGAA